MHSALYNSEVGHLLYCRMLFLLSFYCKHWFKHHLFKMILHCSIFNKSQLPLFASIAFQKGNMLFFINLFIFVMIVKALCGCTIHFQFIICLLYLKHDLHFPKFVVNCFCCLRTRFLQNKLIGMHHCFVVLVNIFYLIDIKNPLHTYTNCELCVQYI